MEKSSVRKALMMTAVATAISAATRYSAPMPLSIRRRDTRRAPTTELTAADAQITNEERRRNVPRLAIAYDADGAPLANLLAASYFDGHLAMTPLGSVWKPSAVSSPLRTTSASSLNVSGTIPV